MRVGVIINPASGPARLRQSADALSAWTRQELSRRGIDAWIGIIEGPGDGARLAQEALGAGAGVIVAWGGDGTINAVASAVVNTPASLGIIPAGSGNGLARELGVPAGREAALAVAVTGRDRAIDAGTLNGHFFFNVAGIGFDAHVAQVFAQDSGRSRGIMRYASTTVRELFRYQPSRYTVRGDGGRVRRDGGALLIAMANTRQWGSGAQVAPGAIPDDGRLDFVLLDARAPVVFLAQLWRLYNKSVARIGGTVMDRLMELSVTATPAAPLHVDGEPIGAATEITVRVLPGALRVRVRQ